MIPFFRRRSGKRSKCIAPICGAVLAPHHGNKIQLGLNCWIRPKRIVLCARVTPSGPLHICSPRIVPGVTLIPLLGGAPYPLYRHAFCCRPHRSTSLEQYTQTFRERARRDFKDRVPGLREIRGPRETFRSSLQGDPAKWLEPWGSKGCFAVLCACVVGEKKNPFLGGKFFLQIQSVGRRATAWSCPSVGG